jgi:hypothetical protein
MNPKIGTKDGNSLNVVISDFVNDENSWWSYFKISALRNARHCSREQGTGYYNNVDSLTGLSTQTACSLLFT